MKYNTEIYKVPYIYMIEIYKINIFYYFTRNFSWILFKKNTKILLYIEQSYLQQSFL